MDKLQMQSKNLVNENIEFIAKRFPNCVTEALDEEGKLTKLVDFDMLKQELSHVVIDGDKERYTMTWPDKKQAILTANAPISKTLRPCKEEGVGKDGTAGGFDSENLYIEGDNLDVLKLLRETYLGKVKMIYIDPPYNTGSDLVYNDDFSSTSEDYFQKSNQVDECGNRLVINNESNGRFHTDWLNMIYSRLKLAKDLLTNEGIILISIDDNEECNLKKVCDEIFGEANYIGDLIRKTKSQTNDSKTGLNYQHEFVLIYARDINCASLKGEPKDTSNYKNPDNDPNGPWIVDNPSARSGSENARFEIVNPYTGTIDVPPQGRYWAFAKATFERWIQSGKVVFRKEVKNGERGFIVKKYLSELRSENNLVDSLFGTDNAYMNQVATKEVNELFNDIGENFSYPKPVSFIYKLVKYATSKNDIVLDFFSGSATTAQAVMRMNAEDGGNRKFIMIQIPEETNNDKYSTICEIGKERIRRSGKQIKEAWMATNNLVGNVAKFSTQEEFINDSNKIQNKILVNINELDVGFRVLRLDSSCMKDVYYSPNKMQQDLLTQLEDNIKEDRTPEDLLFQVMLDMGVLLSSEIKTEIINGKTVFNVNDGDLVCCFDKNIDDDTVTKIAKMQPLYAVFRDSSIKSDSVAVNFDQIFETYSSSTERRII